MYRSVFIFQKRGNLSHCECCVYFSTCVRDESETAFFSLSVPFRSSNDLKHLPPPTPPVSVYIELHVVKWLKPFYNGAHVKKEKKEEKKHKKKKKTWYPQRETKALKKHTQNTQSTSLCPRPHRRALASTAQLSSARHSLG